MPHLTFQLRNPRSTLHVKKHGEQWVLDFDGDIQKEKKEFSILVKKQKVLDGNTCSAGVFINYLEEGERDKQRDEGLGIAKPGQIGLLYLNPERSGTGQHDGGFEVHVRLPLEELHRLRQIDLAAQRIFLRIVTPTPSVTDTRLPFTYGDDPDGKDLVWDTDIAFYSPVEEFQFVIMPVEHTPVEEEGLEEDAFPAPEKNPDISDKASNSLDNVMDQVSRFRKIRSLLRMFGP